ncbi:MAG: HipA family kinase, partial [Planctomycetota bacterium]
MSFSSSPDFQPTCVITYVRSFDSGAGTLLVETDAGMAYVKAKGNPGGPHVLACEYVGTRLATLLGLPTFDYALIQVDKIDELPFAKGGKFAEPGTAFATRSETGTTWDQDKRLLRRLANVDDVSRLVVFDTWVRNPDRFGPNGSRVNLDNVFFSSETSGFEVELRIMDHTHCFTN